MKRLLLLATMFTVVASAFAACNDTVAPNITDPNAPMSERGAFFPRTTWIPAVPLLTEEGKTRNPADIDIRQLAEDVSKWVEENEDRIENFSVDVVNATYDLDSSRGPFASGALITYTLKPEAR